jgi:hypothetical protein
LSVVPAFNPFGDGLRDALDPRHRGKAARLANPKGS